MFSFWWVEFNMWWCTSGVVCRRASDSSNGTAGDGNWQTDGELQPPCSSTQHWCHPAFWGAPLFSVWYICAVVDWPMSTPPPYAQIKKSHVLCMKGTYYVSNDHNHDLHHHLHQANVVCFFYIFVFCLLIPSTISDHQWPLPMWPPPPDGPNNQNALFGLQWCAYQFLSGVQCTKGKPNQNQRRCLCAADYN